MNYFWNCLLCFSKHAKGSVTSFFDIVQFSRSCLAPSAFRLTAYLLYHRSDFCQALFLKLFDLRSNSQYRVARCLSIIPRTFPLVNTFFQFFCDSFLFRLFTHLKAVIASIVISSSPVGRPAPAWCAESLRCRSGCGCHRSAAG